MSNISAQQLAELLGTARWHVAARTFGNDHATLIGIIVDCWVSAGLQYSALEGGPSFKRKGSGMTGAGVCDALLCRDGQALGVLEVEGGRKPQTVGKVDRYFAADYPDLLSLEFGICLFYTFTPTGRGSQRAYPSPVDDSVKQAVEEVSRHNPTKLLAVVTLDKSFDRHVSGIRTRSEYYLGHVSQVRVSVYCEGISQFSATLFPAQRRLY